MKYRIPVGDEWPVYATQTWDEDYIIWPIVSVFICNTILFIVVQFFLKKDNSWIDVWWGPSIVVPNAVVILVRRYKDNPWISMRMYMMFGCVTAWAIRLAAYIWMRHKAEDYRYKQMREAWQRKGMGFYYVMTFLVIYMGQAVATIITAAPVLYVMIQSYGMINDFQKWVTHDDRRIFALDVVGLLIFLGGLGMEVLSDMQLQTHLKHPRPGSGKFCTVGFWRYSRHPNYFGEAMLWWGLYVIACNLEYGWATLFAPIFTSLMLRFVTGVPLLEKKYKDNYGYQQYCKQTNCFVPWKYNKNIGNW